MERERWRLLRFHPVIYVLGQKFYLFEPFLPTRFWDGRLWALPVDALIGETYTYVSDSEHRRRVMEGEHLDCEFRLTVVDKYGSVADVWCEVHRWGARIQ